MLIGCYRKADAIDPEIYSAAVISVLMRYPTSAVAAITEPATGLPSKSKWLPSIAELTEALEAETERLEGSRLPEHRRPAELDRPCAPRPTDAELDAQFERLGLKHLRPGAKFVPPDMSEVPF